MRIDCWTICLVLFLSFIGCSEDPLPEPIQLPPKESMSLDLSLFGGVLVAPSMSEESTYFAVATSHVSKANQAIGIPIATPLQLLKGASDALPETDNVGVQTWDYTLDLNGTVYDGHLQGALVGPEIQWEFYVSSRSLELADFLWIEGSSTPENTQGSWFIQSLPPADTSILIRWELMEQDRLGLLFERRGQPDPSQVVALSYQRDPGPQGDTVSLAIQYSDGDMAQVGWNTSSSEGYVQAPDYVQDGRSCWNTQRQDTICE